MKESNPSSAGAPDGPALQFQTNLARRILLVDDEGDLLLLAAKFLERSGYEVETAADGADGWEALSTEHYDLLITDNEMPNVSGVELLKKLRAARMTLPVIMATGNVPALEFTRYPWIQPAAMLLKPYAIAELLGTVKTVLHAADGARVRQTAPPPEWHKRTPAAAWLR